MVEQSDHIQPKSFSEVRGYQFFESVSATNYPYPYIFTNRYPYPIRIRYDSFSCIQSTGMIEANWCETTPIGGQLQDANLAQTYADQSRVSAVDRHIQILIWSTYTNNFY